MKSLRCFNRHILKLLARLLPLLLLSACQSALINSASEPYPDEAFQANDDFCIQTQAGRFCNRLEPETWDVDAESIGEGRYLFTLTLPTDSDAEVQCCIIAKELNSSRIDGSTIFRWEVDNLDEVAFSIFVSSGSGEWFGINSPLRKIDTIMSRDHLSIFDFPESNGNQRKIYVYDPEPSSINKKAAFIFADGAAWSSYVASYEAIKEIYDLPEILIVTIAGAIGFDDNGIFLRNAEYLIGMSGRTDAFFLHEDFFIDLYSSFITDLLDERCPKCKIYLGGYSNGGDWAYTIANRHVDSFDGVIGLSMVSPSAKRQYPPENYPKKIFLAAGMLEESTLTMNNETKSVREDAGLETEICSAYTGHDNILWKNSLSVAYVWLLGKSTDFDSEYDLICL